MVSTGNIASAVPQDARQHFFQVATPLSPSRLVKSLPRSFSDATGFRIGDMILTISILLTLAIEAGILKFCNDVYIFCNEPDIANQ